MTLVEVVVAMLILGMFLLGFLSTSLQSRRVAEASVMQAAATSLTYGLVEQIKMLGYTSTPFNDPTTLDPYQINDAFPAGKPVATPYPGLCVRLNQDQVTCLQCVNNLDPTVFLAPTTTPTSLAALDPSMANTIGPVPLSTAAGTQSQPLTLQVWAWVDDISNASQDILNGKCVTLVYAYSYNDGHGMKTVINREVIVRTPFAPLRRTVPAS